MPPALGSPPGLGYAGQGASIKRHSFLPFPGDGGSLEGGAGGDNSRDPGWGLPATAPGFLGVSSWKGKQVGTEQGALAKLRAVSNQKQGGELWSQTAVDWAVEGRGQRSEALEATGRTAMILRVR